MDVPEIAKICNSKNIPLVLDATFNTPYLMQPFKHGANIIVHSLTKWLGGHGGVGLAYISKYSLKTDPFNAGWMGAPNPFKMIYDKCDYSRDSKSYTQSTMSYVSIIGLKKSIEELIKLNPFKIEKHSKKLSKFLISRINQKKWKVSQNNKTFNNEKFDVIYHCDVISHFYDPIAEFKKMKEKLNENYTIVKSLLSGNNERPEVKIDWRIYTKNPDNPLIRDLIIEGLSLARTQKEEFASILNSNDGKIDALFKTLERFKLIIFLFKNP